MKPDKPENVIKTKTKNRKNTNTKTNQENILVYIDFFVVVVFLPLNCEPTRKSFAVVLLHGTPQSPGGPLVNPFKSFKGAVFFLFEGLWYIQLLSYICSIYFIIFIYAASFEH